MFHPQPMAREFISVPGVRPHAPIPPIHSMSSSPSPALCGVCMAAAVMAPHIVISEIFQVLHRI